MRLIALGVALCALLVAGPAGAAPDQTIVAQGNGTITLTAGGTLTCTGPLVVSFVVRSGTWTLTENWGPGSNSGNAVEAKALCAAETPLNGGSVATNAGAPVRVCQTAPPPVPASIGIGGFQPYTLTGAGTTASPYVASATQTSCDGRSSFVDRITFTVSSPMSYKHDLIENGATVIHTTATLARLV